MFEGLRRRLGEAIRRRLVLPPPPVPAPPAAAALRAALDAFLAAGPDRALPFLVRGEPLRAGAGERDLARLLEEGGLAVRTAPGTLVPCVRLFPLLGRWIATDLLTHAGEDQVFSLMFEQVYMVRNMDVRPGDAVVEPCLGSGVNALLAAERAGSVTGVEIGPRAAGFARFNAALNGVALEVLEGSLLEPVGDRRFDLVLVNPPFELVPPGEGWFLHSHGGEDGLDVLRALLADLPRRLAPGGRLEMVTWSPATEDGPLLVDLLREALPGHGLEVHLLDGGPLEAHVEPFRERPGFAPWRDGLLRRGIDRVEFLFLRADPGRAPGVEVLRPGEEVAACHAVADAWL